MIYGNDLRRQGGALRFRPLRSVGGPRVVARLSPRECSDRWLAIRRGGVFVGPNTRRGYWGQSALVREGTPVPGAHLGGGERVYLRAVGGPWRSSVGRPGPLRLPWGHEERLTRPPGV